MKKRLQFILGILQVSFVAGCSRGVHGGAPALPLSGTNGTTQVFFAPEVVVITGVSNAFDIGNSNPMGYRGMHLYTAAEEAYLGATNGFVLFPLIGPIASVPLQGQTQVSVPYTACFNITTKALDSSNTTVTVRTIYAKVIDGEEVGVHGGWANHERDVPPVKDEEENVLNAISNALVRAHSPSP